MPFHLRVGRRLPGGMGMQRRRDLRAAEGAMEQHIRAASQRIAEAQLTRTGEA